MRLMTKIEQIGIESGRRILVTSDIHGQLSYFKNVLDRAVFTDSDILFIVGDILEKGPDSLGTLRYVMDIYRRGNVVPLIGNVDAWCIKTIFELNKENAQDLFDYICSKRKWYSSNFYEELASECGYRIESPEDILASKEAVLSRFEQELRFLMQLSTVIETQNYVFVHGGLYEKTVSGNAERNIFQLTKYDAFMSATQHVFDKYIIVGHWPVSLYCDTRQQLNPVINREKRIISIDGGCGTRKERQLNLLIIPDIQCSVDDISHISYDDFPVIKALEDQKEMEGSVYISWINREIQVMSRGTEFSHIRHEQSGKELSVPNAYLVGEHECADISDYRPEVTKGESLSVIFETSEGCIVKKKGVVGWYCGKYERMH